MPQATRTVAAFEKQLRSLADIKVGGKSFQTSQFDKAAVSAQKLQQQQQKLSIQAQELANRQEKARQAADRLAQSQQRLAAASAKSSQALGKNADSHVKAFSAIETSAKKAKAEVDKINVATARQAKEQERIRTQAARNIAQAETIAAKQGATALADSLGKSISLSETLSKRLTSLGGTLQRIGSGLSSAGRILTVALTAPLAAIGVLATKNAVEFDSLRRGLEVMAGSADEAGRQLGRLRELAKAPGLGFQEAIQGSIRLQAVGFSAESAEKQLKEFANAIALTGGGREELSRVTVQLGQLAAKGKIVAQDLKPIIEAAPAVGQALLKAFGTVNSEDIQKLNLSTEEFFKRLDGALEALPRAAAGAKNSFENFADSVFIASVAIGDAILPPLTRLINTLEPIILQLADTFKNLSPQVQSLIIGIGLLAAAAGPLLVALGGIVTAAGELVTALGAVFGVIGAIGFPELLLILAGLAIQITALATAAVLLFKAWQTNFLGIQGIASNAAGAVIQAIGRIKAVLDEIALRVLPTLQSVTTKVLGVITALWEKFGGTVVRFISNAFEAQIRILEAFLRFFGNFVDLIFKLIDGDWRGAWQAFSRIIINALDGLSEFFTKALQAIDRGFRIIVAFIIRQGFRLADAGASLASRLVLSLAVNFIAGAPQISDALSKMLLLAAADVALGPAAGIIRSRLLAEMRQAVAESGVSRPDEPQGLARIRLNPDGSIKGPTRATLSAPGAGGKGDKSAATALRNAQKALEQQQNEFDKTQAQNRLNETRAGIQQQFELNSDALARELDQLKANFDLRLASIKNFFAERKRIQEAAIDVELKKEKDLVKALGDEFANRQKEIELEFQTTVKEVGRDPKLKGRAKDLQVAAAEKKKETESAKALNDFEIQSAEISTRILLLQRQRKDVAAQLTREEKELLKQIQKQETSLAADLLEEQGLTTDAAAVRLRERFKDTIEELRIDFSALTPELQKAINDVDFQALKARLNDLPQPVRDLIALLDISFKKAVVQKQAVDVERTLTELRLHESTIQDKVLDGLLTEKEARAAILAIQQVTRDRLLDILAAQLAIAEATAGQEDEVLRIRGQIQEIRRLGVVIDEVGQQINQELFSDVQQGLEGFFQNARRGFDGLKDAAISFGESLLNTLNKIAAQSITDKLEGIFKPAAGDTQGTPGGFLSKLFGLQPKVADTAAATALTTAGTAAGTALTTGATAASATLTAGSATASATIVSSLTASAAAFAASVTAAGAAFAATVAAGAATQSIGGLGGAFGGGAATGMFPAVPGGVYKVVEGGYPEAVLTTDPKHASRQYAILRTYLDKTKGLFGRIRGFETGGFASARETEMNLLSGFTQPSSMSIVPPSVLASAGGGQARGFRFIFITDERDVKNWVNSAEGERVIVERLQRNQSFKRMIGGK